ncbi:MAG TPA: two-component system response regulator RppA [Coleofasciculaceae cyanobacterium]
MRILLVEDEPDLGRALKQVLERERYVVDWVADGAIAWDYLQQWPYSVGVFDWMVPKLSGLELCQRLRSGGNALPVLILTARDRMDDRVQGLDAGADDYLVKPFGMAELLARLRALLRRSPQWQPTALQVGALTLDGATAQAAVGDRAVQLTAKELQLLEHFMRHPGQIVPRDRLLDRLWEAGDEPASNVVAAQVRLLRRKLAELRCDGAIETVYGLGYRLNPDCTQLSPELKD